MSPRALSYLAIVVAGALTGVLLGHQFAPVAIGPERAATDPGRGQALAVTVPSRRSVGPSSTTDPRQREAPVLLPRLPRATADALVASTAGAKGDARRWQRDVKMRAGELSTSSRTAFAGAGHSAVGDLRASGPGGAIAGSATGQPEEADRAIGRAFYQLAYSQQRHGAAEAAMANYSRAGVLNPDHAGIWYNWGLLLQQRGAVDDAIGKYVRAIRADRSHRYAWYNLGWLLQATGDVESAIRVYERAIAVGAARALTFYNLGWLQQTRGQRALAAQLYRQAIALDPSHVLARYNLGYVLQLSGDLEAAAERYRGVLEIEPGHALARRSLTEIEALPGRQLTAHRR